MSDQITTAQAIGIFSTLAATLGGCVFGQMISQRMLLRYQDAEQKKILADIKALRTGENPLLEPAEASVDHVAELGEKRRPVVANFFAEMGIFFREFFFESKLLLQELFLKAISNNATQKGAKDGADNGAANTCKKGLNAHADNMSRGKSGAQEGLEGQI